MTELEIKQAIACMLDKIWRLKIGLSKQDKTKMANDIYNKITQELGQTPAGVATESEILTFNKNDGIWIASDNGYYYFWNGTGYQKGQPYQAVGIADGSITQSMLDDNLSNKVNTIKRPNLITGFDGRRINVEQRPSYIKITIPKGMGIQYDSTQVPYALKNDVSVEFSGILNTGTIFFDVNTKNIHLEETYLYIPRPSEVALFTFSKTAYLGSIIDLPHYLLEGDLIDNYLNKAVLFRGYTSKKIALKKTGQTLKITIPQKMGIQYDKSKEVYWLPNEVVIETSVILGVVYWNRKTNEIHAEEYNYKPYAQDVLLFNYMSLYGITTDLPSGLVEIDNNIRYAQMIPYKNHLEIIKTGDNSIKIKFPQSFGIRASNDEQAYAFPEATEFNFELEPGNWSYFVLYNKKTNGIRVSNAYENRFGGEILPDEYILFGFTKYGTYISVNLPDSYYKAEYQRNGWVSGDFNYNIDIDTKIQEYTTLFNGSKETDKFLFFTDPHLYWKDITEVYQDKLHRAMVMLQKYYNSSAFNFVLCGGDWLNHEQTPQYAKKCMAEIYGYMNTLFSGKAYNLIGNHDTNMYGYDENGKLENQGGNPTFGNNLLSTLWYNGTGKTYFDWETPQTKYYGFDTGRDFPLEMNEYRWEQIDWFAKSLITDDKKHSAVALHIWTNSNKDKPLKRSPMAVEISNIITAYNNKTTISANGKSYDFRNTTGRVEFVIAGHTHYDTEDIIDSGVPVIVTTNVYDGVEPTFDLLYIDYDKKLIDCIRIGAGSNRQFSLATGKKTK